jgi:hypothetical protein
VVAVGEGGLAHIVARTEPARGVYISAAQIARLEVLPSAPDR